LEHGAERGSEDDEFLLARHAGASCGGVGQRGHGAVPHRLREGARLALESEMPDAAPVKNLPARIGGVCAPLVVRRKSYRIPCTGCRCLDHEAAVRRTDQVEFREPRFGLRTRSMKAMRGHWAPHAHVSTRRRIMPLRSPPPRFSYPWFPASRTARARSTP